MESNISRLDCSCVHLLAGSTLITNLSHRRLNGPCPRSWHNPAIITHVLSHSVILLSSQFLSASTNCPAKCITPRECSNLVWFPLGKTSEQHPSCLIPLSRLKGEVFIIRKASGLNVMSPCTLSCISL